MMRTRLSCRFLLRRRSPRRYPSRARLALLLALVGALSLGVAAASAPDIEDLSLIPYPAWRAGPRAPRSLTLRQSDENQPPGMEEGRYLAVRRATEATSPDAAGGRVQELRISDLPPLPPPRTQRLQPRAQQRPMPASRPSLPLPKLVLRSLRGAR